MCATVVKNLFWGDIFISAHAQIGNMEAQRMWKHCGPALMHTGLYTIQKPIELGFGLRKDTYACISAVTDTSLQADTRKTFLFPNVPLLLLDGQTGKKE